MHRLLLLLIATILSVTALHSREGADKFRTLSAEEFSAAIKGGNVVVIDIRSAQEFSSGYIKGAINIDIKSANFKEELLKLDKSATIAVCCKNGTRSTVAAERLASKGYTVVILENGLESWKEQLTR